MANGAQSKALPVVEDDDLRVRAALRTNKLSTKRLGQRSLAPDGDAGSDR